MRHRGAIAVGLGAVLLGAGARAADANVPGEAQRAAQAIESTLQRHGPEVHRCFEQALADRLDVSGKVEVEVDVGEGGKVTKARALSQDADVGQQLPGCLLASAAGWQVDGIEPGAAVVLPFSFEAQASQFVIKAADAPEHGPGVAKIRGGRSPEPPFSVKILADPVNARTDNVSLTLLTVGPASRVAMHRHPRSAKVLFLIKGKGRLLGPRGTPPQRLEEGMAVFIPAGYPHVIENMGRQARAIFLQAFAPPGPERVYRDPHDAQGRADFEVLRDPARAKLPPPNHGRLVVRAADEAKPISILGGKGAVRILFDEQVTGSSALAVDIIELSPGAELPRQEHEGATELLFVLGGTGTLTVGSEPYRFGADEVVHVPPDQPHSIKIGGTEKMVAIQFYAPAGAEQRFRTADADAPQGHKR